MKHLKGLIIFAAVAAIAACSATPTKRTFSENWRDSVTTSRINIKMGKDKFVKAGNIDVDTWRGVVTITGRTTSEEEKVKAEEIARSVKNVKDVRNYLDVVGPDSVPAKVAKEKKTFSKPTGRHKNAKDISVPAIAVEKKPSTPAAAVEAGVVEEDIAATKPARPAGQMAAEAPDRDGVSRQIGKDLAMTSEDATEDITLQAEEELKELKARKKGR